MRINSVPFPQYLACAVRYASTAQTLLQLPGYARRYD